MRRRGIVDIAHEGAKRVRERSGVEGAKAARRDIVEREMEGDGDGGEGKADYQDRGDREERRKWLCSMPLMRAELSCAEGSFDVSDVSRDVDLTSLLIGSRVYFTVRDLERFVPNECLQDCNAARRRPLTTLHRPRRLIPSSSSRNGH